MNELLCLVKDLTCVCTALPNSMVHVLVLFLASRADRRLHQPCTISSLPRPARRRCRRQEHASGCMQALSFQEFVMPEQRGKDLPRPPSLCPAFCHNCPWIDARKDSSNPTPPALRLHLLPSGSFQDVCRMGVQLCCMSVTMTADMCPRTYSPTGFWTPRHHRCRNLRQNFPNLGPESVVVLPKYEPLPDEIARDLNSWISAWVQECDCRGSNTCIDLRIVLLQQLSFAPA